LFFAAFASLRENVAVASAFCVLVMASAGCGGGGEGGPADDGHADADFGDAGTPDAGSADAGAADGGGKSCKTKQPPAFVPDPTRKKFALSMYHFNVQYVAGGLDVTLKDGTNAVFGEMSRGWTEDKLNHWYITQPFEATLDLYLAHPGWKTDFEFQGYLLELIVNGYPRVLEKLRTLAENGQVETISIHYSDQFFTAFPRADLQKSADITKAIFDGACVPLSGVVFNQEGQDGVGKHDFMAGNGYTIDIFPTNLWLYYHQGVPRAPYYGSRGVDVVVGPGVGYRSDQPLVFETFDPGIEVTWTYFDDGDMMAFPLDPYFAPMSSPEIIAENVARYEEKLVELEQQGFAITSVGDFVAHLKALNVPQPELPPVLDGTWQPIDTQSVWRWLGGRSAVPGNARTERDNTVRTYNYRTRTDCAAAQVLLDAANQEGKGSSALEQHMQTAWKEIMLGEVSDATGITPWIGEFDYGIVHTDNAAAAAQNVIAGALQALGWPHARIDLLAGTAEKTDSIPVPDAPLPTEAPFPVELDAPTRTSAMSWYETGQDAFMFEITLGPAADPTGGDADNCKVTLAFPRFEDEYLYSPALLEDEVAAIDMSVFNHQTPEVYLPLANGLIGLGDGWWVVKDCREVHIAARIPNTGDKVIEFVDATADPQNGATWRFYVLKGGEAAALDFAVRLNTAPVVYK
jgi:hypothetical protein